MIGIVAYGAGNVGNLMRAFHRLGQDVRLMEHPEEAPQATLLVLPGVGAFPPAVRQLEKSGWAETLQDAAHRGQPLLGICLGMQLLCQGSREEGDHQGLGLLAGTVEPLGTLRCPHMGWNRAVWTRDLPPLGRAGEEAGCFYFVHGYALPPGPDTLGVCTEEDRTFTALAGRGPVMGCQFHPERSGPAGLQIYRNIARLVDGREPCEVSAHES